MGDDNGVEFLQWGLPKRGYKWRGFKKPRAQVLKRIRGRMEELNINGGYKEYKKFLEENPEEWETFDSLCFVTISKFFRDRKVWDYIRDEILVEYLQRDDREKPVEIWSAGCCNGEEPYSIAIIADQLMENIPGKSDLQILASDRREELLRRAQKGHYPASVLKELTGEELSNYFRKVDTNGKVTYKINQELAEPIEFEQRNIRESLPDRKFDMVFCRNLVFTYFINEEAVDFLQELKLILKPGGYLIIGSNEILPDTSWLEKVTTAHPVYKKMD